MRSSLTFDGEPNRQDQACAECGRNYRLIKAFIRRDGEKPDVQIPIPSAGVAQARSRALEAVGVAAFAKALEPLAVALPLGEVDARWQPTADQILTVVAGPRISESDRRLLSAGFEAISPAGHA